MFSNTYVMLCFITRYVMLTLDMLSHVMLCYVTLDILCFISHVMLCYITLDMICYVI